MLSEQFTKGTTWVPKEAGLEKRGTDDTHFTWIPEGGSRLPTSYSLFIQKEQEASKPVLK